MLYLLGLATLALVVFVLWWLADGVRALLVRLRLELRRRPTRTPMKLVVAAREDLTDELFRLTLVRADGKRLPRFRGGQYLTVRTPAGARRYSLAAWTARPRQYQLGIRKMVRGQVSGWLHTHACPGLELEVMSPAGDFVLGPVAGEVVLVGGGIGLTPLAAMVDMLVHSSAGRVWLFHAARHQSELISFADYTELDRNCHWFNYRPCLSRPDADWAGLRGHLTAADLTRELADPACAHFYLCARQEMMDDLALGLAALGVPVAHIHRESFGGTATACKGEYKVAIAGHGEYTFRGEPSLLHALETWGMPIEADCRAGECGACRVRLRTGELRACQAVCDPLRPRLRAGEFLACSVIPGTDLEIELPLSCTS